MELTRELAKNKALFETDKNAEANKTKYASQYEYYLKLKNEYENELAEAKQYQAQFSSIYENLQKPVNILIDDLGDKVLTEELMLSYTPKTDEAKQAMILFAMVPPEAWKGKTMKEFGTETLNEIKEGLNYYNDKVNYHLNLTYDPRGIVGDNYNNKKEKSYGNSDVDGPDSNHGTHVSGIIAAKRGNGIGIDGIAGDGNVKIMSVRTVPNGDERDKDVANAIRYAVDNGAKVLNMSFGKAYRYD